MTPGYPENTIIRPQSAPAGPASAGGNVSQTVGQTQQALQNPKRVKNKRNKRSTQHIPQPARTVRVKVGMVLYAQLVLAGVAAGTGSLAYLRYFSTLGFLISTLTAAAIGTVIGAFAAVRRWSALVTAGVSALGFVLVGIFAVFRGTLSHGIPTWETIRSLGAGLVSGWAKMLSVNLPADPSGELELTPALITWIAAVVSATLVLRTKSLLAPILPLVVAFVAAMPLTSPRPVGGLVLVGVLLAEVLLLTLIRAGAADPLARTINTRATIGRFLFGLPVVLLAVAAGLAGMHLVPLADGDDRFDLRDVVPVPLDIHDNINPLSALKAQLRKPGNDMFTVRLSGDTTGIDRVRTVALDEFDGAMWSARDQFMLSGRSLPRDESLADPRQVTVNVTIDGLAGPYLPELGAPVSMSGVPRFGYSKDTGTLATDQQSLAGLSYTLVADVGRQSGLDKSVPYVSPGSDWDRLPDDPKIPLEIQVKGTELAGNVAEPYAKLLAIEKYMQSFPYNLDARPGHSYDALRRLFGANLTDQVGYAEQFASAFVVLARSQGFPARVAVGYLLDKDHKKGDEFQVKSGDAHAWAEVNLAGHGWVTFEPTDPRRHAANAPKPPETETQADNNNKQQQDSTASQPAEDPNLPKLAGAELTVLDWALFVLIGLGVLVVLTPIAIAGEKFRRRRLRRSGSRAARIVGAWQQVTDRLIEHGVPVTASSTTTEVSEQARERIGETGTGSLAVLAPIVTSAMYNPSEPEDNAVQEAWLLEAQLRRELRKARSPFVTVRAWLDPRPLFARWRDERSRRREMDRLTRG
jgi:transglutaminase-like putative cysteine protease